MRFRFSLDKFIASLAYFIEACGPMTKLKLVKLLYLADRRHFNLFGRPVIGDRYVRLGLGPVPSLSKELIDQLEEDLMLRIKPAVEGKTLAKYFKVDKSKKYPLISLGKKPCTDVLSQSDVDALRWTVENYGRLAPSALVDITHKHAAWKKTEALAEIDYRLFPVDDREAVEGIVDLAEAEQRDKAEVMAAFSRVPVSRSASKAIC